MPQKEQAFCARCINPVGFNVINPTNNKLLGFRVYGGQLLCDICAEIFQEKQFPSREYFDNQWEDYLSTHSRVLFAYSGGLDSTVVLTLLTKKCQQKGIELEVFTINTGVKGTKTQRNIASVIDWLGLKNKHFYVNIADKIQGDPIILEKLGEKNSTLNVYRKCYKMNILACGRICNTMMDQAYEEIMQLRGYRDLITGGDTPKKGADNKFSLFWRKSTGITIVRGAYAFGLSKDFNRRFVIGQGLPWVDPGCGGYDTDCLFPGAFLRNALKDEQEISLERIIREFPIILDYFAERVRFGVYERSKTLNSITKIDIANLNSYREFCQILKKE